MFLHWLQKHLDDLVAGIGGTAGTVAGVLKAEVFGFISLGSLADTMILAAAGASATMAVKYLFDRYIYRRTGTKREEE